MYFNVLLQLISLFSIGYMLVIIARFYSLIWLLTAIFICWEEDPLKVFLAKTY